MGYSPSNAAELSPLRRRSRSLWSGFVCGLSKNTYQNERLHFVSAAGVVASGIEDFDSGQYASEGQLTWALADDVKNTSLEDCKLWMALG